MVCSVTPTAVVCTALLGHTVVAWHKTFWLAHCAAAIDFWPAKQARLSPSLQHADTQVAAVLEAVAKVGRRKSVRIELAGDSDREPIYRVPHQARVLLDYHKNAVMNYFAPSALVARSLVKNGLKHGVLNINSQAVMQDTRFLSAFVAPRVSLPRRRCF